MVHNFQTEDEGDVDCGLTELDIVLQSDKGDDLISEFWVGDGLDLFGGMI